MPASLFYGPLVKRLRQRPLTPLTWVRFPHGSPLQRIHTLFAVEQSVGSLFIALYLETAQIKVTARQNHTEYSQHEKNNQELLESSKNSTKSQGIRMEQSSRRYGSNRVWKLCRGPGVVRFALVGHCNLFVTSGFSLSNLLYNRSQ